LFDEPLKGSKSLKTFKISLTFRFDKLWHLSKSVHIGEYSQILTVPNKKKIKCTLMKCQLYPTHTVATWIFVHSCHTCPRSFWITQYFFFSNSDRDFYSENNNESTLFLITVKNVYGLYLFFGDISICLMVSLIQYLVPQWFTF
jgi:hypothetical protein